MASDSEPKFFFYLTPLPAIWTQNPGIGIIWKNNFTVAKIAEHCAWPWLYRLQFAGNMPSWITPFCPTSGMFTQVFQSSMGPLQWSRVKIRGHMIAHRTPPPLPTDYNNVSPAVLVNKTAEMRRLFVAISLTDNDNVLRQKMAHPSYGRQASTSSLQKPQTPVALTALCSWLKQVYSGTTQLELSWVVTSGTSARNLNRLQVAQNELASVVYDAPRSASATELRRHLHWLPVRQMIDYKLALLSYKTRSTGWASIRWFTLVTIISIKLIYTSQKYGQKNTNNHRLRGSASPVLTATAFVNGKG